ncbi:MAG: YhbY family RNA-binding protein [Oscillospiraceae bacterium]|nr:YhbY family RNA-binding protein [Oscillospiraceae bacterium]
MTSKQRAALRKAANRFEPIFQIGKNNLDENQLKGIDEVLTARELIKITVHESSLLTASEAMEILISQLDAQPVQVIGRRLIIYRRNNKLNNYDVE